METLLFSRSDVAARLPVSVCIDAVEAAFAMLGRGEAAAPSSLAVHTATGAFHIKAGVLERNGRTYFVAKTNGNFPGNRAHGLPTIQGVVLLCDAGDGRVLAILDSMELTALRTAAASAVAARYLARPDSTTLAMCGCGLQAGAQVRALCAVLPLRAVHVYDVARQQAERFVTQLENELPLEFHIADDVATAVVDADVCVTCTTSQKFLLGKDMVKPGTFVAAVGVDNEFKREIAPDLMAAVKVVTDLRAQCAQIGDLHHALDAGVMTLADVHADLAAVVAGRRAGRESADEVIIFDSTGIALQDVAAAVAIYETAADASLPRISLSD